MIFLTYSVSANLNGTLVIEKLKERLADTDINLARQDVLPFIKNPEELEIWSNDYFIQLAEMIKFQN